MFESSRFVTTERFYVSPHTQTRILFGDIWRAMGETKYTKYEHQMGIDS